LSGLRHANQNITPCKQAPQGLKDQMVAELAAKVSAKHQKAKRVSDALSATSSIVTAAACEAASKRSRSSSSSGPIVAAFANAGIASAEQELSMSIADLIHSHGLPEGIGNDPKMVTVLQKARAVGAKYKPPDRRAVGGPLLDSLTTHYDKHAGELRGEGVPGDETGGGNGEADEDG
jgi:hypothetical protein